MNKEKECILVTELLPLYLEEQIGIESKEYIEQHIAECMECRKKIEYMNLSYEGIENTHKIESSKIFWKKIRRRLLLGYGIILGLVWIFIIICFM